MGFKGLVTSYLITPRLPLSKSPVDKHQKSYLFVVDFPLDRSQESEPARVRFLSLDSRIDDKDRIPTRPVVPRARITKHLDSRNSHDHYGTEFVRRQKLDAEWSGNT